MQILEVLEIKRNNLDTDLASYIPEIVDKQQPDQALIGLDLASLVEVTPADPESRLGGLEGDAKSR